MRRAPCVVSVAEHTGWAYVVCVAARDHVPTVIERRRVRLIDSGLPTLPYEHESRAMREDEANALIASGVRVREVGGAGVWIGHSGACRHSHFSRISHPGLPYTPARAED